MLFLGMTVEIEMIQGTWSEVSLTKEEANVFDKKQSK